ncbi:sensor domain-containing diguanylate cyclase [Marinomonas mediterranea]|uniref:diguanylate cyclase n=1 Tax=Marinomonas mediterranea (strain ATCC 700492 / JCM 21426 / NBRC 103028 / MMB-1) TaxID=717774 RepID=F2JYJ3_MARM1|nr:diguanylate cyclase [Marinomonas mediterranea]ADZ93122.1 diguanylate cyclase with PAS/PAC and GAF sensors [Marinomonas mediterranea MMB-1]WCN19131.1 diguanylate cyclase [Marinomonas mediterranea MMB-1]
MIRSKTSSDHSCSCHGLSDTTVLQAISNLCEATNSWVCLRSLNGNEICTLPENEPALRALKPSYLKQPARSEKAPSSISQRHKIESIIVHNSEKIGLLELYVVDLEKADAIMTCMQQSIQLSLNQVTRYSQDREETFRHVIDATPIAINYLNGKTGKIEFINKAFQDTFGYALEEIPTLQTWVERAYPDDAVRLNVAAEWIQRIDSYRQQGRSVPSIRTQITCRDGSTRQVLQQIERLGDYRISSFVDLSALSDIESRMQTRYGMLEMLLTKASLDEVLASIVRRIENEACKGFKCSILLLNNARNTYVKSVAPSLPEEYNQAVCGMSIGLGVGSCGTAAYLGERVIVENIMTHEYWRDYLDLAKIGGVQSCWSEPILSSKGHAIGSFAIYNEAPATPSDDDIELISFAAKLASVAIENRLAQRKLEEQAFYDHLTGLVNRRRFFELAEVSLQESIEQNYPLSILMLDIDRFKEINDRFGHETGDRVLQALARCASSLVGKNDVVGRFGGEEFTILLPQSDRKRAASLAKTLRQALSELRTPSSTGIDVQFTASFGVVCNDAKNRSIDDLLSKADHALYQAKGNGRNCVVSYTPQKPTSFTPNISNR